MKPFPQHPRKILIRSTNWIGDAVMSTPAVRTIRENFPESEITLLVHPWVADVFRYSPRVDQIFLYEKKARHQGIKGMVHLAGELRQQQYDCAILLQNAFEAALITAMAGIPARGGYPTDGRGLLLTHRVTKAPELITKHEVHYYQRIVRGLGMKAAPSELELFIPGDILAAARKRLETLSGRTKEAAPVIGLNPGAAFGPAKRWPPERYAELADALSRQTGATFVIFGSAADQETAATILRQVGRSTKPVLDLTGRTTLIEAMAMIGECDAFVTNDSGLMHVAAALRTPTVAIFGSTDHIRTGPLAGNATVIRRPLPCSPCKKPQCPEKHFRCMKLIPSDEVVRAVMAQLEQP